MAMRVGEFTPKNKKVSATKPKAKKVVKDVDELQENVDTNTSVVDGWFKPTEFTPEEIEELEMIALTYLDNYPLRTAMHRLALMKVCKCTLRYNQALSDNDLDALKVWDSALSKALKEAKINPEQLSAADLSDGISNFSKISEAVEKEIDIIPALPQYTKRPHDDVDYTIWLFINYLRRLNNLPECKYSDIYAFIEEKYKENKKDLPFLEKPVNGNYDDEMEGF